MTDGALFPGLILAGGKSSRMGEDKAFLTIGRDTILGHVVRRLAPQVSEITLNAPRDFPNPLRLPLLPDSVEGQIGPLAGILSGLRHLQARGISASHLLTVPSDSPFVPPDLVARLAVQAGDNSTIVISASDGRDHPVFGLWPLSIADDLETWLSNPDNRRIKSFFERHPLMTVEFQMIETSNGLLDPFFNINTREELEQAHRFAGELS